MIIKVIYKYKNNFLQQKHRIAIILKIIIPILLINVKKHKNVICTEQSLYEYLVPNNKVILDYKDIKEFDKDSAQFSTKSESPANTILITGNIWNFKHLLTLYSSLKIMNGLMKNIVIKIKNIDNFYRKYYKLFQKNKYKEFDKFYVTHFLATAPLNNSNKMKSIFKPKNIEKLGYFAILDVEFSDKSYLEYNLLSNVQSNSDLFFIASKSFKIKAKFGIQYLFYCEFITNKLHLSIRKEIAEINKLVTLIRSLNNLHSHSLGTYYYLPFDNFHIRFENLLIIFICIILLDFVNHHQKLLKISNLHSKDILIVILHPFIPIISVVYSFLNIKSYYLRPFIIIYYFVFNFNIGLIYATMIFLLNI